MYAYAVIDLGTLPRHESSRALGINNTGVVVGESTQGFINQHACVWDTFGNAQEITSANSSVALSISNAAHMVGMSGNEGWMFHEEVLHNLGSLGGPFCAPYCVNDSGVVVGVSFTQKYENHAFLWRDGTMIDLFPKLHYSVATAINERSDVVGFFQSTSPVGISTVAFLRSTHGELVELASLGGAHSIASDVNDHGLVVGHSWLSTGYHHACLWRDGTVFDLGTLWGNNSEAYAVNNAGMVIGSSGDSFFLWSEEGDMVDLRDLIGPTNFRLEQITDINDRGDIVGWGYFAHSPHHHAVLLRRHCFH